MDCSALGFPVLYSQSWLKRMSIESVDAIQHSHPLPPPSPALSLSQYQGLFQWVGSLHQVTKVLELQLQHQSFQWTDLISLLSKELSRVFSSTTIWKHQFFGTQPSLWSHICTGLQEMVFNWNSISCVSGDQGFLHFLFVSDSHQTGPRQMQMLKEINHRLCCSYQVVASGEVHSLYVACLWFIQVKKGNLKNMVWSKPQDERGR